MNFASKYVYVPPDEEYEYVSDEEYEEGLNVSDDEDDDAVPPPPPRSESRFGSGIRSFFSRKKGKQHHWRREVQPEAPQISGKRFRRADTNVVSITLKALKDPSNMHAGDAVKCQGSGCPAVMSHISRLSAGMSGKVWECEFCGTQNEVDVEEGEVPKDHDVTYLLEAALATEAAGPSGIDESIVVFCIDISGSMCVSTEVQGNIQLRRPPTNNSLKNLNTDGSDQYLPGQKRNVTYVSRLQFMQAAVDKQLEDMVKEFPNRKVAIICFNNEIRIMDEGVNTDQVIAGQKLNDENELNRLGSEIVSPKPVKETQHALAEKIFNLEEGGQTALGPALVVALGLASRCAGSKIIVCTDGVANVGLGRLDEGTPEERERFYDDIGEKAVEKGVSISVTSIKGADSKLYFLGKLADKTNGQVNSVDPSKLTEEFGNILQDRIIASNVKATMILHKDLEFTDKDTQNNVYVENIGNARMDTEITFHYKNATTQCNAEENNIASGSSATKIDPESDSKREAEKGPVEVPQDSTAKCAPNPSETGPTELPFQLQLEYTDTYGTKALRVITEKRPITQNRKEAEESVNLELIGVHTAQTVANQALKGEYTQARGTALMNQRLAWRTAKESSEKKQAYKKMFNNIRVADAHVNIAQQRERIRYGRSHSDSEGEDEVDTAPAGAQKECCVVSAPPAPGASKGKSKLKKKSKRSDEVQDDMASDFYMFKRSNATDLLQ